MPSHAYIASLSLSLFCVSVSASSVESSGHAFCCEVGSSRHPSSSGIVVVLGFLFFFGDFSATFELRQSGVL